MVKKSDPKVEELTLDLQRVRADFENYRKRVEAEKSQARQFGQTEMVIKLLPVIDDIERAVSHIPKDLTENTWAHGIATLHKNLEKKLESMNIKKIDTKPGAAFNPDLHHAVQFDETSEGDKEVIAEELQAGYMMNGHVLREAMVKVTRQD